MKFWRIHILPLILDDIFGSPNVGVYGFSNETVCLVPFGLPPRKIQRFHETLNAEIIECSIGGSYVVGALVSGNSQGILVPHTIRDYEMKAIKKKTDLKVEILKERWTAIGNLVLANDYGAVVDPRIPEPIVEKISNILGVNVVKGEVYGLPFVGSLAIATNKGAIAHPKIRETEKENIQETLQVPVETGTINGGVPYPKSGLLANSYGAISGTLTSGPELMAISQIMGV
jgi:translation initiation factor 6